MIKLVLISDTHNKHDGVTIPSCDIFILSGDLTGRGSLVEIDRFLQWFSNQPATHKIFIAGNHDFGFEEVPEKTNELLRKYPNVTYLQDSFVIVEGIKIWGSPIQPWFHSWAFNRLRGEDIKKHWDLIPDDVDILITHGPAFGILDQTPRGEHVGCEDLLDAINTRVKPTIHVSGHIHPAYGYTTRFLNEENRTMHFFNASILNESYEIQNKPFVVEFDVDTKSITLETNN